MFTMLAQQSRRSLGPTAANNLALVTSEELRSTEEKMQASFLNCCIEEEDLIDNTQPNLISVGLTDSYSSRLSSENMSQGNGFEPSATIYKDNMSSSPVLGVEITSQQLNLHHDTNLQPTLPNEIPTHIFDRSSNVCRTFTFGDPTCDSESKSKLSSSMHDISKIPSYPLVSKSNNISSETIQSQSITTVASLPKSKDSGFPRSLSCLSLTSGKSYEHVQSKVKEYIRHIKEVNKTKRKLTYGHTPNVKASSNQSNTGLCEESTDAHMLVPIINKLKDELEEKDRMLLKLQENYDTLLMKYAAAENRLDHLRINAIGNSFNVTPSEYKKPKASPNMLLLPNLCNLQNASYKSTAAQRYCKPETLKQQPKVAELPPTMLDTCSASKLEKSMPILTSESLDIHPLPDENLGGDLHSDQIESDPIGYLGDSESLCKDQTTSIGDTKLPIEMLNFQQENPYVKVKRWQESLPYLDLIEPNNYEQVNCRHIKNKNVLLENGKMEEIDISIINDSDTGDLITREEKSTRKDASVIINVPEEFIDNIEIVQTVLKENSVKSEFSHDAPKYYQIISPSNNHSGGVKNLYTGTGKDSSRGTSTVPCHMSEFKSDMHDSDASCDLQELINPEVSNVNQTVTIPISSPTILGLSSDYPNCNSITRTLVTGETCDMTSPVKKESQYSAIVADDVLKPNFTHTKYLPPICTSYRKTSLIPMPTKVQPITKKQTVMGTEPAMSLYKPTSKEIDPDRSYQKRMLGQKARQLLFEYLKKSTIPCCTCTREDALMCSCNSHNIFRIASRRPTLESEISFRDKNVSLVQCLDEMNECAQKLRGKSEAIMRVLSKQLKES